MINGEHANKIKELQLVLRIKGILRNQEEIFDIMIRLFKREFKKY